MTGTLSPSHYRITITPDLNTFRFHGQVTVDFNAPTPVEAVRLNLLELAVWQCRLLINGAAEVCSFSIDAPLETLSIALPRPQQGAFQIEITYEGVINDRMMGFYRSAYTQDDEQRFIAVTQFQESAARQAFPCMDHPLYKAVFELELIVPEHLSAIANTPIAREQRLPNGTKNVVFEPTPTMSTYLVFFGVGDFEFTHHPQDAGVRIVTLPGLRHTTDLGLSFGSKALRYCEDYYGIDYPLQKMDLIAIPDFAFGAMENWGAITFRENLLLNFTETTSAEGVERICEVIAHEIAHQWFGNLVTPQDWKYLWLNESFATYFGYGVVDHHYPEWETWDQFLHSQTGTALARDGLTATVPIEMSGGEHMAINAATAPIIYNKGASMLRMIEGYIGKDGYKKGVRTYLANHAYGCAESRHLWEAFEDAAALPVTAMVKNWVSQPGYPLITVERQDHLLTLRQERFTYLSKENHRQNWIIPVAIDFITNNGEVQREVVLFDGPSQDIAIPDDTIAYKANAGQTGFYRVHYHDEKNIAALGKSIEDGALSTVDRWGLQNDLFALTRAGRVTLTSYLEFLNYYHKEERYLPLAGIVAALAQAFHVVSGPVRFSVAERGRALARQILSSIGFEPQDGEAHTRATLRNELLWQSAQWGLKPALECGVQQCEQLMAGKNVHPDLARSIMQVGARVLGVTALEWFKERFAASSSEHERMNILTALGAFSRWEEIEHALAFALEKVPSRNQFLPIVAAAANPASADHMWGWYQEHLLELETFHPLLYERVITGVVPLAGIGRMKDVSAFFTEYEKENPQYKDAIALALENLAINERMRAWCER